MEIRIEFEDGTEMFWQTQGHKNINAMVEALKENVDKPRKEIHICIINKQ